VFGDLEAQHGVKRGQVSSKTGRILARQRHEVEPVDTDSPRFRARPSAAVESSNPCSRIAGSTRAKPCSAKP